MMARTELQRILAEVQRITRETLGEMAGEGRRIGVSAERELQGMIVGARATGRERLIVFGGELEKLGRKLKKLARGAKIVTSGKPARKVVRRDAVHVPH